MAAVTLKTIWKLKFGLLSHPAYSVDFIQLPKIWTTQRYVM